MNIVVCIKQVLDPNYFSQVVLDPVTKLVRREGVPSITNPVDRNAIEQALQIRERFSGKVTVMTMGPPQAREALDESLAMGADEAILLCDRAFAGADSFATSYTLAAAIEKLCPFDLVLCGNGTVDSGTKQVGPQLAELLDVPHVTNVRAMSFVGEEAILAECPLENGHMKVEARLPALVTVNKGINEPRLTTIFGIMEVAAKPLKTCGLADLGLSRDEVGLAGSPTQMTDAFEFKQRRRHEMLQGTPDQVAGEAVSRLRELHAL
ncbi:MAG: electron transfer flavoprotein subunit beta/FixA family protein [Chloroflexi bacterium]|nr:electron transfer flavoprotein subunit beta/FixA family protein [Chloroflexota bacterium]